MQLSLLKMFLITATYAVAFAVFMPLGVLGMLLAMVPGTSASLLIILARREQLVAILWATSGAMIGVAGYLVWWWAILSDRQRSYATSSLIYKVCLAIAACWIAGALLGRMVQRRRLRRALKASAINQPAIEPAIEPGINQAAPKQVVETLPPEPRG